MLPAPVSGLAQAPAAGAAGEDGQPLYRAVFSGFQVCEIKRKFVTFNVCGYRAIALHPTPCIPVTVTESIGIRGVGRREESPNTNGHRAS